MMLLQGTVVSMPPQKRKAGPCRLVCLDAPQRGAMVVMRASPPADVVANPPCECPVPPMWVVSMRWYIGLEGSAVCFSTQVTPASIGAGVPCATFVLLDAMTTKPCEARCLSSAP